MSNIAQAIDTVTRNGLAKLLKADGYIKKGRNFYLASESFIKVVNVQGSQGNVGSTGRFYVNMGVYIHRIASLLEHEIPKSKLPMEHQCTIRDRLEPARKSDTWNIPPTTDLNKVATSLERAWAAHGRLWMDQDWGDLSKALEVLHERHWYEPAIAAALLLNDLASAEGLTKEASTWFKKNDNDNAAGWIIRRTEELKSKI